MKPTNVPSHPMKFIQQEIKHFYPGWIMRVYHDNSIRDTIKCDMECLKDDDSGKLIIFAENILNIVS